MSNTLLTPDEITREALVILHSQLNFIGNIDRQHEASFGRSGRQIGDSIRIRLPNQYTVRTGPVWSAPAITEQQRTLTVDRYRGVDMNFTDQEMALRMQDFSERHLRPAMAQLASTIEADALSMINSVNQAVVNIGAPMGFRQVGEARRTLTEALAPTTDRCLLLNPRDNLDYVDANKGLFHDSSAVKQQYREGMTGRTQGFDVYENTLIPTSTTGTAAAATGYNINGAGQTGSSIAINTGTLTFAVGDIVTLPGVFRVHPETKASTGDLMQFTVTAAYAGGAGNLQIAPAIVTTGARQNVSASPTNGQAVVKVGGASAVYRPSLAFHKEAFTFATADLELPNGVDAASRKVMDGISLRYISDFDSVNGRWIRRIDVLYGFLAQRPELAVRILSN